VSANIPLHVEKIRKGSAECEKMRLMPEHSIRETKESRPNVPSVDFAKCAKRCGSRLQQSPSQLRRCEARAASWCQGVSGQNRPSKECCPGNRSHRSIRTMSEEFRRQRATLFSRPLEKGTTVTRESSMQLSLAFSILPPTQIWRSLKSDLHRSSRMSGTQIRG